MPRTPHLQIVTPENTSRLQRAQNRPPRIDRVLKSEIGTLLGLTREIEAMVARLERAIEEDDWIAARCIIGQARRDLGDVRCAIEIVAR